MIRPDFTEDTAYGSACIDGINYLYDFDAGALSGGYIPVIRVLILEITPIGIKSILRLRPVSIWHRVRL